MIKIWRHWFLLLHPPWSSVPCLLFWEILFCDLRIFDSFVLASNCFHDRIWVYITPSSYTYIAKCPLLWILKKSFYNFTSKNKMIPLVLLACVKYSRYKLLMSLNSSTYVKIWKYSEVNCKLLYGSLVLNVQIYFPIY